MSDPQKNVPIRWSDLTKWTPLAKWVAGIVWSLIVIASTYVWTQWNQQKAGLAANKQEIQAVDTKLTAGIQEANNKMDRAVEKIDRVEVSQTKADTKLDKFAERFDSKFDKLTEIILDNRKPAIRPMTIEPHAAGDALNQDTQRTQ